MRAWAIKEAAIGLGIAPPSKHRPAITRAAAVMESPTPCEAALHGVALGPAMEGLVRADVDGRPRELVWRRDFGLVPSLSALR